MSSLPTPARRMLRYIILIAVTMTIALSLPGEYLIDDIQRWTAITLSLLGALVVSGLIFKVTGLKR